MISEKTFITYESEVRSYCRSFPVIFTTAKGSLMYDQTGKEYIDFFCGAGALNYGHNNPYIKRKVMDYLNTDGIIHAGVVNKERKIREYLKQRIDGNYDIRGIGCIWGIDVKSGELSRKIIERCFEKGLICERAGRKNSVIKIMPALNIDDSLLFTGLEIICDSISKLKL